MSWQLRLTPDWSGICNSRTSIPRLNSTITTVQTQAPNDVPVQDGGTSFLVSIFTSSLWFSHFFLISIWPVSLGWLFILINDENEGEATGRDWEKTRWPPPSDPHPLSRHLAEWHWPMTPTSLHCHILRAVKSMSETRRVGAAREWNGTEE